MPTYVFQCKTCEHSFERLLKIANMDEPLSENCPECGKPSVQRIVGGSHAFMTPESLGRKKAPEEFRNWLSAVKKVNPGSTIRDR